MGLFFNFNRTPKQKILIKLWNSFFVKEKLIENYQVNNEIADAIIIAKCGIFLFKIFLERGDLIEYRKKSKIWTLDTGKEIVSIENPIESLDIIKKDILNLLNDNTLPIYICPIFSKANIEYSDMVFNLPGFRKFVMKQENVLSSEDIDEYFYILTKHQNENFENNNNNNR